MKPNQDYSYLDAGFDSFLSRSVDDLNQVTLDSTGPASRAVAFDRSQISGPMGDTMRIGNIRINGSDGNIVINDGNNDFLIMGNDGGQ